MSKKPQYTWKAKIATKAGPRFVMLSIRCENKNCWYLYIDEHPWHGPFDFPDQAADSAHWCCAPLPAALGITDPVTTLGVSDKLSEWVKVTA